MPITIHAPKPTPQVHTNTVYASDSDSDDGGGVDLDGDLNMSRPAKRARNAGHHDIVTPGEVITDDPQWMRGHGTYVSAADGSIVSSVAGTITRTNKLLSVRPLRARYTPEIGDLVVGRIVEVQPKRWRVDSFAVDASARGADQIEVTLGVNGYIWISKLVKADGESAAAAGEVVGLNRMEDTVSANVYSSQNDRIDTETMREISRIRSVIMALVENGLRVDEDTVSTGYQIAVDMGHESAEDDIYLGGERGQRLAAAMIASEA
ncbi:putative transcriptional regulatory protein [Verticillium dahliae VDG2]|nr:putative transcriptional regulatory protein [Verticillium dahliae VDG2]